MQVGLPPWHGRRHCGRNIGLSVRAPSACLMLEQSRSGTCGWAWVSLLTNRRPSAGSAYGHSALGPSTGTYVGCMFGDYMNLLRVALQQRHTGPVMTGARLVASGMALACCIC